MYTKLKRSADYLCIFTPITTNNHLTITQQQHQLNLQQHQQPLQRGQQTRDYASLQLEVFELLCIFQRVKRIQSKDTTQCGQLVQDNTINDEQRSEHINRSMYRILNEIETKIVSLPNNTGNPITPDYFDEWSFLTWALLQIINRLEAMNINEINLLDYGGKHFKEKIHTSLVELVNKAHRMQPPPTLQPNDQQFERFYQSYVTALISLHELYTMTQHQQHKSGQIFEFEAHIAHFKSQLNCCFSLQRNFANSHGAIIWKQLREHQIRKMTNYGYENKGFLDSAVTFYAHMLYNLGVLAARIHGFSYEIRNNKTFVSGHFDLVKPLLAIVYKMADVLLSDSIICLEPSLNPILVTNNLFQMKIVSLCRFSFFRDFSLQIVSEEVAQQIQQEIIHHKTFDPPSPIRKKQIFFIFNRTRTAALLAMKPATGVKRNNAKASDEGGNTAHKKSDVNSKEWISIPPLYDTEHGGWCATYPHLLCTTRQKDTLLETRSAVQTGKRPLFYFHVKAELFSFSGAFTTAHTLSLPFTIATRRNQDCQVQRMMSSYTATCFWLYGTNVLDGLLLQWHDGEIDWKHFKLLYSLYFSMNAEVTRTFTDEDFTILQQKMHCSECTEVSINQLNNIEQFNQQQNNIQFISDKRISFKNVLCPHLHFTSTNCDLRFKLFYRRGMLELLHLFNDQKTETRNLWEAGLLQGFMELNTVIYFNIFSDGEVVVPKLKFKSDNQVHSLLRTLPGSGLVMRLSLVAGACVCITVKCSNDELLDLEPLEVKKLQSKNLNDYLKDIILAEKVDFVLDSDKQWLHVTEVLKRCQKFSSDNNDYTQEIKTKEILSNALHPGPIRKQHSITFTPMRVAVVTCKTNVTDNNNEPDDEFATENNSLKADSLQELNNQQPVDDEKINFEREINQIMLTIPKNKFLLGQQQIIIGNDHNDETNGNNNFKRSIPSSSALSSNLEEENNISTNYSLNKHISVNENNKQIESERFYFSNSNIMPTMNRPIVARPSISKNNLSYMFAPTISSIDSHDNHSINSIISSSIDLSNTSSIYSNNNSNNSSNTICCTSSCCSSTLSTTINQEDQHKNNKNYLFTINGNGNITEPTTIISNNPILYQQMSLIQKHSLQHSQQQITEGNVFQGLNYNQQQHLNPSAEQRHQQEIQQQQFNFRL
ncbi:hypothetical protein Mgra_00008157 [Meloidogyne graminicola]|uniref:Uncharacterized protein n=1 Tax=Meloidogyne graminicola TaxID=189291 RepID=A0A8S9ZGV0_9BILA|nr:hypothetical protein Mgra_00008157 [Meloidogyne graminicola]